MAVDSFASMNDITAVSAKEDIEKVNTMQITRNVEVRAKTFIWILAGFVLGAVMCLLVGSIAGFKIGVAFIPLCTVAVPFFTIGSVRDMTRETRWKRALHTLQSKNIEGGVFYVNSVQPEDITNLHELTIR